MSTEPARTDTSTDNATTDNATTDNAANDTSESLPILRSNESASSLEDVIIASDFRSAVASSQQKPAIVAVPVAVVPAVVPAAVPTVVPAVVPVPVPAPSAVLSLPECLYGVAYHLANPHGNVATGNNGDCTDTIDPQQMPIVSPSLQLLGEHEHEISLTALRKIAATGIPDDDAEGSCRAVTWRVLLGYLPVHTNQWSATLEHQRGLYSSFVHDLFGPVSDVTATAHELRGKRRHWSTHGTRPDSNLAESQDHSSSSASSVEAQVQPVVAAQPPMQPQELPAAVKDYWKSKGKDLHVLENLTRNMNALHLQEAATVAEAPQEPWQDFCESAVLLDEIRKDVVRTHPDLSFYLEPDKGSRRYAALERILFVWSKFNRGVRYVQGMNEIVGTLYYVLSNDWNDEWADHAEADTYWLLNTLLSDMRDVFVPDLDDAETGIQGRIAHMHTLLGRHDPEVKEHLEDCGIDASFYAIRWWTTLLSREFLLPDTIRLWDSMMGSTHKDNFLRYVCVTMVILVRGKTAGYPSTLLLLLVDTFTITHSLHCHDPLLLLYRCSIEGRLCSVLAHPSELPVDSYGSHVGVQPGLVDLRITNYVGLPQGGH